MGGASEVQTSCLSSSYRQKVAPVPTAGLAVRCPGGFWVGGGGLLGPAALREGRGGRWGQKDRKELSYPSSDWFQTNSGVRRLSSGPNDPVLERMFCRSTLDPTHRGGGAPGTGRAGSAGRGRPAPARWGRGRPAAAASSSGGTTGRRGAEG